MSHILLITSSPRGEASYSSKVARSLAQKLAQKLASRDLKTTMAVRDLHANPLPHIGDEYAAARAAAGMGQTLSAAQKATLALSDELLEEFFAADILVIGSGMINFGIPSTLKTYIDYILRPGATFRYTEKGPEGLARGKKAYLVSARGGVYTEGPMQSFNFQDTYLRTALGFMGITDIESVFIEGVAFGPEVAEKSYAAALAKVATLTA